MKTLFFSLCLFVFLISSCKKIRVGTVLVGPFQHFYASVSMVRVWGVNHFVDQSENDPTAWLWDFGDGVTSALANPDHIYANPGIYSVKLTVTNSAGSNTLEKQNFISVVSIYAGLFQCDGIFNHPTGGLRIIDEQKILTAVSTYEVETSLGDLGASSPIKIQINPLNNLCTVVEVPPATYSITMTAGEVSRFDPSTGKYFLWYEYEGSTGIRKIIEEYSPL